MEAPGQLPGILNLALRSLLTCMLDWFLAWSDVSVGQTFLTGLDISAEEDEDLHGG